MKELLTVKELTTVLKVSEKTVYNWVDKGMPIIKLGGLNRFDVDEVLSWHAEQQQKKAK